MKVVDVRLPNDPSGTAVGVGFPESLVASLLEGLKAAADISPTLGEKTEEIRAELLDAGNPLAGQGMRLVRIERQIDFESLRKKGRLRVTDCDRRKVLALAAALLSAGEPGIGVLEGILSTLVKGGIPIKVEGHPEAGNSVFIRLFDESLEVKMVRPA